MSKNIIIQEGGEGRQFTASKLKTALVGGGSCNWIPEDEATLGTKSITEDGTYEATSDGLYGYSSVTVRGIGKVTGKDPVTGEETEVTTETDPQTGEQTIKTKVIPSSIRITTPPTRLVYNVGDLIDMYPGGMVVKAYLKSGAVFTDETYPDGIIPDAELDKPVKTANADGDPDGEHDTPEGIYYISDGGLVRCCTQLATQAYPNEVNYAKIPAGVKYAAFYNGTGTYYIIAMSTEDFNAAETCHTWTGQSEPITEDTFRTIQFPYNGVNYYYVTLNWYSPAPVPTGDIEHNEWTGAILVAAVNIMFLQPTRQKIPVNWISPYDGKTLTDHFTITVNPAPEPEPNAEPESDPEGGETP